MKQFRLILLAWAILLAATLVTATASEPGGSDLYPQTFIVTGVSQPDADCVQLITVETVTGFVYGFYSDAGDWSPGDLVSCIMDSNHTEMICDDAILDVRYAGIAEWFVEIYPN